VNDLVVIDTPPLTVVSDAFPLLMKVDGVVVVGWVGRSLRDVAERLHQVLSSSGAPLLGVIANGSKSGGPDAYAYTYAKAISRPLPSPQPTAPPRRRSSCRPSGAELPSGSARSYTRSDPLNRPKRGVCSVACV